MSSKKFIEGFIELYHSHECLWKVSSPEYINKNLKNSAYKELVEYCKHFNDEANSDFVKQKIQNLRTTFRKELKKVQDSKTSGTGTDDVYTPKLWYYDLLLFTVDDVLPMPSLDSGTNGTTYYEYDDENSVQQEFFEDDGRSESSKKFKMHDVSEIAFEIQNSARTLPGGVAKSKNFNFPSTSTSQKSARNQLNKSIRKRKFLVTCMNAINQINKHNKTPNDVDEFDALAITWAAKVRKLKEEQLVLAEDLINQVLRKAYFKELTQATKIKDDLTI